MSLHTDTLLYIHMPKTGGMWVSHILRLLGAMSVPGTVRHTPLSGIPHGYKVNKTIFGTIRDAYSFYPSLWQHLGAGVDGPPVAEALGRGDRSFPAVLEGLTDPSVWPEALRNGGWPTPERAPAEQSYYSWLVNHFYGNPLQIIVLLETTLLHQGLSALIGEPVDPERFPPRNASQHRPASHVARPASLYDLSLSQRVADADADVRKRLGYKEPFSQLAPMTLYVSA